MRNGRCMRCGAQATTACVRASERWRARAHRISKYSLQLEKNTLRYAQEEDAENIPCKARHHMRAHIE
eukprot:3951494-Pleurochrysis_carterae.AAC.1